MKISKTAQVTRDVVVESYSLCDKCNEKIATSMFDAFEFKLEYTSGENYPEGGSGEMSEMELCVNCVDACIKLLEEGGYRINKSEWDS